MTLILGNIIAFIASVVMVYSGIVKNKKKIIYVQSIEIGLFVISNLILNGITGAIINVISFIRNILCYNNKLGLKEKIGITILSIVTVLLFNNMGFIGLLPLFSTLIYLWLMTIKNVIKFKLLIIFTMFLWLVYDFAIKSYASCVFDIFTVVTNIIAIFSIKRSKKTI